MSNETRNPLGYLDDWKPYRKGQIMLAQVQHILDEYREHLPLTCRQIYYRMIGEFGHAKGKQFERSLYDLLVNARRARLIPFAHIRDDGIMNCGGYWYENAAQKWNAVEASLRNYQRNRQQNQPQRIEVWCEAAGMIPQLRRITHDYSIPVYSCGGFNSLTAIRQIVDDCVDCGEDTVVLHLGDYDPSGISIFERVRDDVTAFLAEDDPFVNFEATRVALTKEQIDEHRLPMDRITTKDQRSLKWIREGRTHKCELEALAPNVVAGLLSRAIEDLVDRDALEEVERQERRERSGLWCLRGIPDFEIPPRPDFKDGRRPLGDFARRVLADRNSSRVGFRRDRP
jgi:hypothetical protein